MATTVAARRTRRRPGRHRPDHAGRAGRQGTDGGQPVGGAFVRLLNGDGDFAGEVVASSEGDFRFYAAPGDWTVRALHRTGNGQASVHAGRPRPARGRHRRRLTCPLAAARDARGSGAAVVRTVTAGPPCRPVAIAGRVEQFYTALLVLVVVAVAWFSCTSVYRLFAITADRHTVSAMTEHRRPPAGQRRRGGPGGRGTGQAHPAPQPAAVRRPAHPRRHGEPARGPGTARRSACRCCRWSACGAAAGEVVYPTIDGPFHVRPADHLRPRRQAVPVLRVAVLAAGRGRQGDPPRGSGDRLVAAAAGRHDRAAAVARHAVSRRSTTARRAP